MSTETKELKELPDYDKRYNEDYCECGRPVKGGEIDYTAINLMLHGIIYPVEKCPECRCGMNSSTLR